MISSPRSRSPASAMAGAAAPIAIKETSPVFNMGIPRRRQSNEMAGRAAAQAPRGNPPTVDARRRAGTREDTRLRTAMRPQPHGFVAQTEKDRAVTIPWTKARATGASAGLLAHGSGLDARPSQALHARIGPVAIPCPMGMEECASRSPLTVAGTALELDGNPPSPCSQLCPFGHRRDQCGAG